MTKNIFKYALLFLLCIGTVTLVSAQSSDGWISLFNGKNLDGWKVGENASTFSIEDGTIKVAGPKAHLYYMGEVGNHDFKNFEFKAQVMTMPGSNSGIYIHTRYMDADWPKYGYEVQVNNSHTDWKRSGSLYDIVDIRENYAKDNEWYTTYIKVQDKRIIVKINDIVVIDYTEPEHPLMKDRNEHRLLSHGTFALQGHDPKSIIFYKDIMVKPLP